jgi:hypothetical protein
MLKKKAAKPQNPQVRIRPDVMRKLRGFGPVLDRKVRMEDVASDALDDYLKKRGATIAVTFLALFVTLATQVQAEDPVDPVVCDPSQAPIVLERRTDALVVAHVEFAAPLPTSCTFRVASQAWSVERCDADGICTPRPFRNTTYACPFPPHFPDRRCVDEGRILFAPRGRGLYIVRLEVQLLDGVTTLASSSLIRTGRRPARAR